jgi:hypothetical protein
MAEEDKPQPQGHWSTSDGKPIWSPSPGPGEPGYSQDLLGDIVEAIAASEESEEKKTPQTSPPERLKHDHHSGVDGAVLTVSELLFLLFGLPFGDALYHDQIAPRHWLFLSIAIFCAIAGPMWPAIRNRYASPRIAASVAGAARDARVWVVVLLAFFLYGVAPDIYQRATKPVAVTGAIGAMPIGSAFGPTVYTEGGAIGWVLDSQFLTTSYATSGDVVNSVFIQGKSRASASLKEAYAISNLTGHRQPMYINIPNKGSYPVTRVDIPPQADVQLEMYWNPPLSVQDFLDQWGRLRAVVVYEDGTTWEHEFDEAYVRDRLNRQIPSAFGPRVTLKDAK